MPEKKRAKSSKEVIQIEKKISIRRTNPENIKPIFSNDFIVANNDDEFFLTFSLLEPFLIESEDELTEIDSIEAVARVKLALTPDFAKRVSKALITNIERYEAKFKNDTKDDSSAKK